MKQEKSQARTCLSLSPPDAPRPLVPPQGSGEGTSKARMDWRLGVFVDLRFCPAFQRSKAKSEPVASAGGFSLKKPYLESSFSGIRILDPSRLFSESATVELGLRQFTRWVVEHAESAVSHQGRLWWSSHHEGGHLGRFSEFPSARIELTGDRLVVRLEVLVSDR